MLFLLRAAHLQIVDGIHDTTYLASEFALTKNAKLRLGIVDPVELASKAIRRIAGPPDVSNLSDRQLDNAQYLGFLVQNSIEIKFQQKLGCPS